MSTKKLFQTRNWVNEEISDAPKYINMVIADALTNGHKEQMTSDWLRKVLVQSVEDGFITYEQALELKPRYEEIIKKY